MTGRALPATDRVRAPRRAWWGLALLLLPMLALATDLTVLFFAMPTLSADLRPTATEGLWILHVYGFLIGGFLVTMGRLGDRVGPRRLLLTGSAAFAVLSLAAAFSPGTGTLIAVRALLGVAGATLMPSLFSLLRTMFVDDTQRRLAIAVMFSAFSVGGAVGPLLGGALLERFWWGSVFLVNVPMMLLLVAAGPHLLPERSERARVRLDLRSVALSVAGMLAVVFGIQELAAGQEHGDGAVLRHLAVVAVGAVLLAAFVRRQRRHPEPLFDLALLADPRISASLGALLLNGVGVVGIFYLFTQHLQWVNGLTPLQAGIWTLPYIALNVAGAMLGPRFAQRWPPTHVVTAGLGVAAAATLGLVVVASSGAPLVGLVTAVAVAGFGQGTAMALISDLIISSAPEEQTGSAAAAQEVGGEVGTALGIATAGAVGVATYRRTLPSAADLGASSESARRAGTSIPDGLAVGADDPAVLDGVEAAITHGLQTYAVIATVLVTAAALLIAALLVRRPRVAATPDDEP